jgi:hypothetical protein
MHDRVSDAIAELRRVLPVIIADDERFLATLDNPPPELQRRMILVARSRTERELDSLRRLFAALPELRWRLGRSRTPPWQRGEDLPMFFMKQIASLTVTRTRCSIFRHGPRLRRQERRTAVGLGQTWR